MNDYISSKAEDFESAIEHFKTDIKTLRTGRATPSLLEGVQVEAYGTVSPLKALANINVDDARTLVVAPWDKSSVRNVEKAIEDADLGVNVSNEGEKIRVSIPEMTEEKRKEMVRKLNEKLEKARISIRHIREEIKTSIEEAEKSKEITEDEKFRYIKELDEEVDKKNNQLKEIRDKKEEDVMKV
jgi:ribosome recycling factor